MRPATAAIAIAAAIAWTPHAPATTTRDIDFVALEKRAATVFYGKCIARRTVDEGARISYVEYQFEILDGVKGCRDSKGRRLRRVVFRHAQLRPRTLPDGTRFVPPKLGIPTYAIGDELVLFLTRESRLGLCAPVGLRQGCFRVTRRGNRRYAQNGVENRHLFRDVRESAFRKSAAGALATAKLEGARLELGLLLELCRGVAR